MGLSRGEHRALLALAVGAAEAGGRVITDEVPHATQVGSKISALDPVTRADVRSEAEVLQHLTDARPDDGIHAEESGDRPSATGVRWVIDALDGSVNHLYGIPHVAVSIAVEVSVDYAWESVVAVVHDPLRGETFTAVRDEGAALDGDSLYVNDPVPLSQALVATEFAYTPASRRRQASTATRILSTARDIRSTGSSALDLCWTAAGRFDAFYEDELGRWDWAAGRLVVIEAGGSTAPMGTGLRAAGPALHRELAPLLEP